MDNIKPCLFCNEKAYYYGTGPLHQVYNVQCPNCGTYNISRIIKDRDLDTVKKYAPHKHLISGLIRERNELGIETELIVTKNIMNLTIDPLIPKTIPQKLDKILGYYYRRNSTFGEQHKVNQNTPYSIGYCHNFEEFRIMIKTLVDNGLFSEGQSTLDAMRFSLSLDGHHRAEELISPSAYLGNVFVAMGFYPDLLEAFSVAIKPACSECGFDAKLCTDNEHNDDINARIITDLEKSVFVITDFTYNNNGAYFEAGYAQGKGLKVIRTCNKVWFDGNDEKGKKNNLHFDVNHYKFILWNDYEDLKEKLVTRIRETILK